jgi:hypothetical protein
VSHRGQRIARWLLVLRRPTGGEDVPFRKNAILGAHRITGVRAIRQAEEAEQSASGAVELRERIAMAARD